MRVLTILCSIGLAAGCGGTDVDAAGPGSPGAAGATAVEPVIDRDALKGSACAVIGAAEVAELAGVPAAQVQEPAKCIFHWPDGSASASARLHRSVQRAQQHFASFTQDVDAAQLRAGKQSLQAELDAGADAGEIDRREAAVGGALARAMPEDAITHQALAGLGNEAVMENRGVVKIRSGNVTVDVAAKRGGEEIDRELTLAIARRVVANLQSL